MSRAAAPHTKLDLPAAVLSREPAQNGGKRVVFIASNDNPAAERGQVPGHRPRRLIAGDEPDLTDPFVLMAEDWMPRDAFGIHPHRGIETVTYVLDGAVEHFDSAGNFGVERAGDAHWMTAGRGIRHRENAPVGTTAHTLQLYGNDWVERIAAGPSPAGHGRWQANGMAAGTGSDLAVSRHVEVH